MAGARDYVYIALAVGLVFGALYVATGNWPPAVVVKSNSMMHVDADEYQEGHGDTRADGVGFGRTGTLDPGDLILVDEVDENTSISTFAEGGEDHYGKPGDVIVYRHTGTGTDLMVVHRAMTHVEVSGQGANRTYTVQWTDAWAEPPDQISRCSKEPTYTCTFNQRGVLIPELGVFTCGSGQPSSGGLGQRCPNPQPKPFLGPGFITKGDNEASNPTADQAPVRRGEKALNPQPVAPQQILGEARGEIPALGLWKVAFSGSQINNAQIQDHPHYIRIGNMVAPLDLWGLALLEVVAISAVPVTVKIGRQVWEARGEERAPELSALRRAARSPRDR